MDKKFDSNEIVDMMGTSTERVKRETERKWSRTMKSKTISIQATAGNTPLQII